MGIFSSREKHYRNKVGSTHITNYDDLSKLFKNLEEKDRNDNNFYTTITQSTVSLKIVENVKTLICSFENNPTIDECDELIKNLKDVYKIFERNIYTNQKGDITSIEEFDKLFHALSNCELLSDRDNGSFKELLKFIITKIDKLIKDVDRAINYYEGKQLDIGQTIYYWTIGWGSYITNMATFKKMSNYYKEYKRDLVTFKSDVNNFIKDIIFVNGMFTKLESKLKDIKSDVQKLNTTLATMENNPQLKQHKTKEAQTIFTKKKNLSIGYIGSIISKLNLKRIE